MRDRESGFFVSGAFTIQKQNVRSIPDYLRWCRQMRLPTLFMSVFNFPHSLRPDLFCDSVREAEGWSEALRESMRLAEELDSDVADLRRPFIDQPILSADTLRPYVETITRSISASKRHPARTIRLDKAELPAGVPAIIHFRKETTEVAYAFPDEGGEMHVRLPSGDFQMLGYQDIYAQELLFHQTIHVR